MDVQELADMSSDKRRDWYIAKLGPFENQLRESAANHIVPIQLLATVILNELAEINNVDLVQSGIEAEKGSLGIAQIQIDTAMRDKLFPDITAREEREAGDRAISSVISPFWTFQTVRHQLRRMSHPL